MKKGLSKDYLAYINSAKWKQGWRRKATLALLGGRCILCPILRATDCDHLTYRNLKQELPIRDLVPLSSPAHRLVTMVRSLARAVLGRQLGNGLVAWSLRGILFGEYFLVFWGVMEIWNLLLSNGN